MTTRALHSVTACVLRVIRRFLTLRFMDRKAMQEYFRSHPARGVILDTVHPARRCLQAELSMDEAISRLEIRKTVKILDGVEQDKVTEIARNQDAVYFPRPRPPLDPPLDPPLPPRFPSIDRAPRPPVRFLMAFLELIRPSGLPASGASSDTFVLLFDGVAPILVRISIAFVRSFDVETSLASN